MKINISSIISILGAIIGWVKGKKATWGYLVKITTPLIAQAEQLALDGKIDKEDRKKLVMNGVAILERDGKIKLNFITRWILKRVINSICKKLPDFTVTQDCEKVIKEAKLSLKK